MSEIAVGVRVWDHTADCGWATISAVIGDQFTVDWDSGETGTQLWSPDDFRFDQPNDPRHPGPVRTETVTKRRIVPGVYGRLEVRGRDDDCVTLLLASRGGKIDNGFAHILNATELDDLAMVASQLAEALRDQ